jgi:hypothetical protein
MTVRRRFRVLALAGALAAVAAAPAAAEQTPAQRFFAERLIADVKTAPAIKVLLQSGGGLVDRAPVFRDLTGDGRPDAVVRVHSGGAAGVVAVYVFSTDTGVAGAQLTPVFRAQSLRRAATRVRAGTLRYRDSRYAEGDDVCCPTRQVDTMLRWDARRHRFRVAVRRDVVRAPAPTPLPTPAPAPTPAPTAAPAA